MMITKKINIISILFFSILLSGCSDVFDPANENILGIDYMNQHPDYAEGILINAYSVLPGNSWSFNDVATDDAVSNDVDNNFKKIATGGWTNTNDPLSQWVGSQNAIQNLNIFLGKADSVKWSRTSEVNTLFRRRMKGEAYGLRGLFLFYLLQAHAGWTGSDESGELLGVPIFLEPQSINSDLDKSRSTFEECMEQIYSDLDKAIDLLALDYRELNDVSELPDKFEQFSLGSYNRVFGNYGKQRMSGRIAMAIKAKAALLAASPAFQSSNNSTTWVDAAEYSGKLLTLNNGIDGIAPEGDTWYTNDAQISDIGGGSNPPEIIWRGDVVENTDLEEQNFPPTLYGNGRVNPTQNLVDAFPMKNGYPISDASSGYDPSKPYENRIPLLSDYIVTNGSTAGVSGDEIITAVDGTSNDALNKVATSTTTGYYLRKLLRQNVNLNPNSVNSQTHYKARIRYTEIYLIYAEAANEAWGPKGTGTFGFSAFDVIKALREREGVNQPDDYLQSIGSNKEEMRKLIRNTRRIELCFEGKRFWDIRRWNEEMTTTAKGIKIEDNHPVLINVEDRKFKDFMRFGPIPYDAILRYDALQQNYGWK